jgi:hypothetical protein
MRRETSVNYPVQHLKKDKRRQLVKKPVCLKCDLVCNPLFPPTKYRLSGWQCPGCLGVSKIPVDQRNHNIWDVYDYE